MDFTILKTLRKSKNIKLISMAKEIGISPAYLSMIERGKRQPKVETIEDICRTLRCIDLLFVMKLDCSG